MAFEAHAEDAGLDTPALGYTRKYRIFAEGWAIGPFCSIVLKNERGYRLYLFFLLFAFLRNVHFPLSRFGAATIPHPSALTRAKGATKWHKTKNMQALFHEENQGQNQGTRAQAGAHTWLVCDSAPSPSIARTARALSVQRRRDRCVRRIMQERMQ